MSEALSFVLSATKRRPIKGLSLTDPLILSALGQGDNVQGRATVVTETGDVTSPTLALAIDGSSGITIWDGVSVVYAAGVIVGVQNGNQLVFQLNVASLALNAALALSSFINAIFEMRITVATGQDEQMMSEPVAIRKTGSSLVTGVPSWAIPGIIYGWWVTALRGANSVEQVVTTGLATGTILHFILSAITVEYTLTVGTADPTDLNGQVAPLDYNAVTNARYWRKTL